VVVGPWSAAWGQVTDVEQRLIAAVDRLEGESLALLEETVNIPSGTLNLDGVRRVGEVFAEEFRRIGFETRWAEMPPEMQRAGHLVAEHQGTQGQRLLLIGHLDTVLEGARFQRDGDIARGNGTVDMKAGNIIILQALKALKEVGALEDCRVIVVLTGDEEDAGMPLSISRAALIEAAGRSDRALGFENAVGKTATVARRGVADWRLEVRARTGHSESILTEQYGAGAIYEASRILDAFRRDVALKLGVTLNPSVIAGGTTAQIDTVTKQGTAEGKTNVIPAAVVVEGDLRFLSPEKRREAEAAMRRTLKDHLQHASAELTFAANEYPAMAPTQENYAILDVLNRASEDLGMGKVEALDPLRRGAGDISFVAHLLPCLDGLGARGNGAHTPDEDVDLTSIPEQTRRAALLIYRLTR
jgi:glutamate carboxypeptidase